MLLLGELQCGDDDGGGGSDGDGTTLLRPNYEYYATKAVLPALNRCFALLGVDVGRW